MFSPIFPLLLILLAIGSILRYQKTTNDIYQALAVSSVIFALIWGFAITHWSIHLLVLILLLRINPLSFSLAPITVPK